MSAEAIPGTCDVVVVGGGPAGSLSATFLRQKGYDVVLFDKEKHPRPHVGESIIPHIWKYCDMAGVADEIAAEGFIQKSGGTTIWNGLIRQMSFSSFGYDRPALHVERDRFDHILLEHARRNEARIFERVAVLHVEFGDGSRPVVEYRHVESGETGQVACRFVVDCTGQNSVVGKQLDLRYIDEAFRFMSVWGYFKDSKYVAQRGEVHPFSDLRTVPPTTFVSSLDAVGDWGWSWHIPLRESTSVGLVVPLAQVNASKMGGGTLEAFLLETCERTPILGRLLDGATFIPGSMEACRDYSYRMRQLAGPGYFLAGDAAGFIDPIFSVGCVLAMYTAKMASWAIDNAFRDPSSAARYQRLYATQLEGRIEVSRQLALPQYESSGRSSDMARTSVRFESLFEQELMYVVSTMTTRASNLVDMVGRRDGTKVEVESERFRTLEQLNFPPDLAASGPGILRS